MTMAMFERFRHNLSTFILWCAFLGLYLGGAVLLVIGLVFAVRMWWALIEQNAGLWALSTKSAEVFVLAAGFVLVLIIPFRQYRAAAGTRLWRSERRSGVNRLKGNFNGAE